MRVFMSQPTTSAQLAAAQKLGGEYYGALDGFRGVLALIIAVYHTIWLTHFNASAFLNNGAVLVDLFFVFSGFLMFRLYDGKLKTIGEGGDFMRKRLARIYPLHFFMLMVFVGYQVLRVLSHLVGISVVEPGEILPFQPGAAETLSSFFANLTLTQSMGLFSSLSFNPPAWTVSVEFFAYIVFLMSMMLCPPKRTAHFLIIALGIAAIYGTLSNLKPNMDFHYDYGFWRCLAGFYTGVFTAWLYGKIKHATRNGDRTLWGSALEIFTLVALYTFIVFSPGKTQFLFAPFAILFVLTFAIGRGWVSTFMTTKPLLYLGKISYSIYMVHVLISIFFGVFAERIMPGIAGPNWNANGFGGDLLILPYLGAVIIISHFTYKYVERPGQKAILAYKIPERVRRVFKSASLAS